MSAWFNRGKGGIGNGMFTAELTDRNPGFSFAEDTDDLFVGKTLLHGNVFIWLMKTLLTSWCINQRGGDHPYRLLEVLPGRYARN